MQTLADFLSWAEEYFIANKLIFGHGTSNAWDEAVAIAMYVLNLNPNVTKDVLARKLLIQEREALMELANKRASKCIPVPYLTHEAWFCGEKYYVDQRVIIPRSPLAELIKNRFQPWLKKKKIYRVLDLCTGSGCIAVAIAKTFPQTIVDAVDISQEALEVAKYNIQQHEIKDRVHIVHSDLFKNLKGRKYDIIVSNPPYVSSKEYYHLPTEYQCEPTLALVSGNDGWDCTRKILEQAYEFLQLKGLLFVEVGSSWKNLSKQYPNLPLRWLSFVHGGEGVFMLTKEQLKR